jgi:hypothetical protein
VHAAHLETRVTNTGGGVRQQRGLSALMNVIYLIAYMEAIRSDKNSGEIHQFNELLIHQNYYLRSLMILYELRM